MQGTILILDGVSTNRIMLKVQLSAAWYHVVQGDRLLGLEALVRRVQPDLILCAMTLPDGSALDVRDLLQQDEATAGIPIIAITAENDRSSRLAALGAGIDDVLSQPYDDVILLARIRSLIRAHTGSEELRMQGGSQALGLAEASPPFQGPLPTSNIALITQSPGTGAVWRARLKGCTRHHLDLHKIDDMQHLLTDRVPDAIVVELCDSVTGLRLLADLRARSATRNAAVIAIPNPANAHLAADALDRGADDVMPAGFCVEELSLRLETQLRRKARADRFRDSVRDGLRAALIDPMTGLHNRRFALPELARIAREAAASGQSFAVMMADLDHFKQVNDRFGHPAGDAVLMETARRLRSQLRVEDVLARVGGEEFMMVLPNTTRTQALKMADLLCQRINRELFRIPGQKTPIPITTSIGLFAIDGQCLTTPFDSRNVPTLLEQADRALYEAKGAGRNQVSLIAAAA
ncbi:diguanylate cyclase [Falsiruegeria mediterranea]|uniref:diguanylate cyclase n=1 Tax=Falsiruegeria mediterranea M17 TaxID=1200281 RepID=A0A2R8CFC7_9RHOB|nr:diguanylate cyclase [Falsiruegeria mediterranea]SPJ31109.1 Response regulator PleD [Falsiruegeria mediterranea M17]